MNRSRRDVTAPLSWHVGTITVIGIALTAGAAPIVAWTLTGALVAAGLRKWSTR